MTVPPLIVGASAGSGKTYRLTTEVTRALTPGSELAVHLEGLVAVTYTRKAEAELASRIRQALVARGAFDEAARLPVAYLGTVHAVCMRLLEELALDAGLSPYPEVMPDDGGRRMREAIEESLPRELIESLDAVARRLEILFDSRTGRYDWIRRVFEVMELARGNRIAADALPAMARRSAAALVAHLAPAGDAAAIDDAFAVELDRVIAGLAGDGESTKGTRDALAEAREVRDRRARGDHRWSDWMKAAKLAPSVKHRELIAPLREAALACHAHPELHQDLRDATVGIFEAARLSLTGYAAWKSARRIVDYTDMIDRALTLIEGPQVAAELASRLDLLVVDELQDTSPLQLALFTRLHALTGRSVWVGDGKQCIFEYAGADPRLMDSLVAWVERQGGGAERLERNYRSRRELVDGCSELFARAFAALGVSEASVRVTAERATPPELASTPPFAVWWLDGKSVEGDAEAIASVTARMLAAATTRVLDRVTGGVRPVEARDVGILTSTNAEAKRIAAALGRRGIHATVPRDGLLETPEGVLVDAALRWLLEDGDLPARATLEALGGWNGATPDGWLEAWLRGEGRAPPAWLSTLAGLREQLGTLTPSEALDRTLHALDVSTWCARWPDPRQRLGNLEALRALAARYEDRCARLREPATLAGLVRYFDEARQPLMIGDEERATDDQFAGGGDHAVTVSTYHRAKGLEWPLVVLTSLDRPRRRDAFDPSPESDRAEFDPDDPLGGRWIRYWPWPFGKHEQVPLTADVAASTTGRAVADRERRERLRLLYVGFTRARDQLVLAVRHGKGAAKAAWLDELRAGDGSRLLELPAPTNEGGSSTLRIAGLPFVCGTSGADDAEPAPAPVSPRRLARGLPTLAAPPRYRITPSARQDDAAARTYVVDRVSSIGSPVVPPTTTSWNLLGDVVHAFLAIDRVDDDPARRLARATRLLGEAGLTTALPLDALLGASERLWRHVEQRWPGAACEREVPITAFVDDIAGRRRIEGVIDLLVTTPAGVVVVDHKTYPAPSLTMVAERAGAYTVQLAQYAEALTRCGRHVLGVHLHFPLAGAWVDLRPG
jgi:ATP-dependent exoDNAse (exonuclease V) beta subunit